MDFNDGLNGWNVFFTVLCVLGTTMGVLSFIRRDLLLKIQGVSSRAVATIVKDKENIDVISFRLNEAESSVAELRVRVARLEHGITVRRPGGHLDGDSV